MVDQVGKAVGGTIEELAPDRADRHFHLVTAERDLDVADALAGDDARDHGDEASRVGERGEHVFSDVGRRRRPRGLRRRQLDAVWFHSVLPGFAVHGFAARNVSTPRIVGTESRERECRRGCRKTAT